MKREDILYVGVSVNPVEIKNLLQGTPFADFSVKQEAHMTIAFRPDEGRLAELLPLVGKEMSLSVEAIGTLTENGVLMNVGLKVGADSLEEVFMPTNIPHVTVWINVEAGAKAFNTFKCQWNTPLNAVLNGKIALYNGRNEWDFTVE